MKEKGSTVLQKAQEKTMSVIKVGTDDSCPGCPEYTLESDAAVFHRDSHMKRLSSPAQEHSTSLGTGELISSATGMFFLDQTNSHLQIHSVLWRISHQVFEMEKKQGRSGGCSKYWLTAACSF